jgi:nitrogen fixation NifU-like protein
MSNLEDLYREIILDHYRSPRNRGELPSPPALRVEGFNPLCGDELVVYLDVRDGVLVDIKMTGHGCSKVDLRSIGELGALQGVVKFPVRIKCAVLAWNTLSQGLDELA